jgi:hypothetical protein
MRFFLIFILIHFGIGTALSQEAEEVTMSKVNKAIDSLKSKGVSKIGFKKDRCISGYHMKGDCKYYRLYLFWQNGAQGFIKRFDACGESQELTIDPRGLFEYPDRYFDTMKNEKVKMFSKWIKRNNDSTRIYVSVDHSCHRDLLLLNKGDSLFKSIDFFDLGETDIQGVPNQSSAENKKLKIVEWEERLSAIIRKLEDEKKFKTSN